MALPERFAAAVKIFENIPMVDRDTVNTMLLLDDKRTIAKNTVLIDRSINLL